MTKYRLINITTIDSGYAGSLSFFEGGSGGGCGRDIPFEIKRIYYIHGVPDGSARGAHAHKQLRQLLFCPIGSIEIQLDDGDTKESVFLDSPSKGLLLEPGLWRDMIWHSEGAILCVAASQYYDESDYIRDYGKFLEWKANNGK